MDYFRNSFAKNIEGIVTLYDVRYTYSKHKQLIHSDPGLKEKFRERIQGLISKIDDVTGETIPVSNCPLLISAVEEIVESLDEPIIQIEKPIKNKSIHFEVAEEVKKKRPSLFTEDCNDLEDFFQKRSTSSNILEEVTLEVIKKALDKFDSNLTQTAKHLGISSRTLRTKIQDIKKRELA